MAEPRPRPGPLHLRSALGLLRSRGAVFFLFFLLLIGFLSAFGAVVISNCLFFAIMVFFIALTGKRKRENEDIGYKVSEINISLFKKKKKVKLFSFRERKQLLEYVRQATAPVSSSPTPAWPVETARHLGRRAVSAQPARPLSYACARAVAMPVLYIRFPHFHHTSLQHYVPIPFFSLQSNLPEPERNQK